MTEVEWRQRYAARIQQATHCSDEEAAQCAAQVVLDDGDFDLDEDSPEEAADDEMGYWDDDEDDDNDA